MWNNHARNIKWKLLISASLLYDSNIIHCLDFNNQLKAWKQIMVLYTVPLLLVKIKYKKFLFLTEKLLLKERWYSPSVLPKSGRLWILSRNLKNLGTGTSHRDLHLTIFITTEGGGCLCQKILWVSVTHYIMKVCDQQYFEGLWLRILWRCATNNIVKVCVQKYCEGLCLCPIIPA